MQDRLVTCASSSYDGICKAAHSDDVVEWTSLGSAKLQNTESVQSPQTPEGVAVKRRPLRRPSHAGTSSMPTSEASTISDGKHSQIPSAHVGYPYPPFSKTNLQSLDTAAKAFKCSPDTGNMTEPTASTQDVGKYSRLKQWLQQQTKDEAVTGDGLSLDAHQRTEVGHSSKRGKDIVLLNPHQEWIDCAQHLLLNPQVQKGLEPGQVNMNPHEAWRQKAALAFIPRKKQRRSQHQAENTHAEHTISEKCIVSLCVPVFGTPANPAIRKKHGQTQDHGEAVFQMTSDNIPGPHLSSSQMQAC